MFFFFTAKEPLVWVGSSVLKKRFPFLSVHQSESGNIFWLQGTLFRWFLWCRSNHTVMITHILWHFWTVQVKRMFLGNPSVHISMCKRDALLYKVLLAQYSIQILTMYKTTPFMYSCFFFSKTLDSVNTESLQSHIYSSHLFSETMFFICIYDQLGSKALLTEIFLILYRMKPSATTFLFLFFTLTPFPTCTHPLILCLNLSYSVRACGDTITLCHCKLQMLPLWYY